MVVKSYKFNKQETKIISLVESFYNRKSGGCLYDGQRANADHEFKVFALKID